MTDLAYPEIHEADRLALAAHQPYLMTGGRPSGDTRCMVLLAESWHSADDMCPNGATHRVQVYDYRAGFSTDGVFQPARTTTRVCDNHERLVRVAPGFISSAPLVVA